MHYIGLPNASIYSHYFRLFDIKIKNVCIIKTVLFQALLLNPQSAGTYSAIAYVHVLMGHYEDAVDWFHKALGLKRDDTFSTTMLNYVIDQLTEEQPPYSGKNGFLLEVIILKLIFITVL